MWFKKLTGFDEISPENVRKNLKVEGQQLISTVNHKTFQVGKLEILTLGELRNLAPALQNFKDKITVRQIVEDVQYLHQSTENAHALFQVASQFNLLEMVNPQVTPEMGVDRYENDYTQGPTCAIACGAGTIFRNYFVKINGKTGQTEDNQINCLQKIGKRLNNDKLQLWTMSNGYALLNQAGLSTINTILGNMNSEEEDVLKASLQIGLQWGTEVTIAEEKLLVSQAYCSALPVAYPDIASVYWKPFASLILEASYEATFYAALINLEKTGCPKVFLTLVGGGAFGNEIEWILSAILKSLIKFKHTPLEVNIVAFKQPNAAISNLIREFERCR